MIRWTAILIISLALAATAGAYEYLGPNNYGSSNLTLAGTIVYVQEYRTPFKGVIVSYNIYMNTGYDGDTTWAVLYSASGENPGTRLQKSTAYHTGTGSGSVWLSTAATCTLQAGTRYFIGICHKSGIAGSSTIRKHDYAKRYPGCYYKADTADNTWPTATDTWDNTGIMPYVRVAMEALFDSGYNAYDTTVYTVVDTLDKCTFMRGRYDAEEPPTGTPPIKEDTTYITLGFDDKTGLLYDSTMYGLMAFGVNVDSWNNYLQSLMDVMIYDSVRFKWVSKTGTLTADKFDIYWVCRPNWVEDNCSWRYFRTDSVWALGGAIALTDRYSGAFKVDSFTEADTTVDSFFYFGSDTSAAGCDGWLRVCDSISDSGWSMGAGFWLGRRTNPTADEWLNIGSDDNATAANRPIMWFRFLDIYQMDTTTPSTWTGNRHDEALNRHDEAGDRHGG